MKKPVFRQVNQEDKQSVTMNENDTVHKCFWLV